MNIKYRCFIDELDVGSVNREVEDHSKVLAFAMGKKALSGGISEVECWTC